MDGLRHRTGPQTADQMSTGISIRVPRDGYSQLVEMEMCTRNEIINHFEKLDAQGRLDWCLLLAGFAVGSARRVEALEKQLADNPS